jgi:hypothetical protein
VQYWYVCVIYFCVSTSHSTAQALYSLSPDTVFQDIGAVSGIRYRDAYLQYAAYIHSGVAVESEMVMEMVDEWNTAFFKNRAATDTTQINNEFESVMCALEAAPRRGGPSTPSPEHTPAPLDGHGSSSGSPPRRRSPSPNDDRIVEEQGDLPDPDDDEPADEQHDAEHPSRRREQVNLSLSDFEDSDREEDEGAHDRTLAPAHNSDALDYEGDNAAPPAKRKHASSSKAGC